MMDENLSQQRILIVDDAPENVDVLGRALADYKRSVALTGEKALQRAFSDTPPDLILLDVMMPGLDGFEVCRRLKAEPHTHDIPIIFISALSETLDKVKAFASGGVDYITKPFQIEEVRARVETHLKLRRYQVFLEELVKEKVKEISDSQMATIFALSKLAESRDSDTGHHLERTQSFCRLLAGQLRQEKPHKTAISDEFVLNLSNASPLHDIGKVGIPDAVLLKPGKLTLAEFETMQTHTTIGAQTLEELQRQYPRNSFINMGISVARSHHERWDGQGYPGRLAGEAIPLAARIMAVADVYDALRSKRCYKDSLGREPCRAILVAGRDSQFDPAVVDAFLAVEDEFDRIGRGMGFA
jgi:putative two-component system response regulator